MANNVIAQVTGGERKILDNVASVNDIRTALSLGDNYIGSINGSPANLTDEVEAGDFVTFAEKVKGQAPKAKAKKKAAPKAKAKVKKPATKTK